MCVCVCMCELWIHNQEHRPTCIDSAEVRCKGERSRGSGGRIAKKMIRGHPSKRCKASDGRQLQYTVGAAVLSRQSACRSPGDKNTWASAVESTSSPTRHSSACSGFLYFYISDSNRCFLNAACMDPLVCAVIPGQVEWSFFFGRVNGRGSVTSRSVFSSN